MRFPTSQWPLRQLELWVLCQATGVDRLPTPLTFHTGTDDATDFHVAVRRTTLDLLARYSHDDEFERAVMLLAHPWVQVQVVGTAYEDGHEEAAADSIIRIFAGVDSGAGAVAIQAPGPTEDIGGDIDFWLDDPDSIAARITGALSIGKPGKQPGFGFRKTQIGPPDEFASPTSWGLSAAPSQSASPRQVMRAFRNRPVDRITEITISPGAAKGGIPNTGRTFRVVDFTGDGTYLIRDTRTTVTVTPATPDVVAAETDRHVRGYLNAANNIPH